MSGFCPICHPPTLEGGWQPDRLMATPPGLMVQILSKSNQKYDIEISRSFWSRAYFYVQIRLISAECWRMQKKWRRIVYILHQFLFFKENIDQNRATIIFVWFSTKKVFWNKFCSRIVSRASYWCSATVRQLVKTFCRKKRWTSWNLPQSRPGWLFEYIM